MSCPDPTYSPNGRHGIGVVQPQSGLDYPFVKPSDDVRYLVADFYLEHEHANYQQPFSIYNLTNIGCTEQADVIIKDAAGVTVLDTGTATVRRKDAWGTDYLIYEWQTGTMICRLVAYTTWAPDDTDAHVYASSITPESAVLDARTVYMLPKRLLSLSVKQKNGATVLGPYTGKLAFKNFYNTTVSIDEQTSVNGLNTSAVRIGAVAGTGAGYYPVCGSGYDALTHEIIPQPIRQINGVTGTAAGDFLMSATDCLYMRRPTTQISSSIAPSNTAQQQIGADCTPCCQCPDYVNTALYMNQISSQYRLIGQRTNDVKLIHEQNIARWSDRRNCSLQNPLQLIFVPQCCPTMDVVMMLCNPCQSCIPGSTLTLTLNAEVAAIVTAEVVCGYTALYATNINGQAVPLTTTLNDPSNLTVSAKLPAVAIGGTAYVKFRLKFSQRGTYAITGNLTGTLDAPYSTDILTGCANETPEGERTQAVAVATQALYCSPDGNTETPC